MRRYFKSAEFWQCLVFLLLALMEIGAFGIRMASTGQTGVIFASLLLIGGPIFLLKSFGSAVRWRLRNPEDKESPVVRIFLYGTGTLAFSLQVVWFTILKR